MKEETTTHEPHDRGAISIRLNWLRAAVLGANDGVVSVAGLVVGVAGATTNVHAIFIAGLAGLVAGALAMSVGEYVSVSSQRDTETALIEKETYELKHYPEQELKELTLIYQNKGLSKATAHTVAKELTDHDPIRAHLDAELNMSADELSSPMHAAVASAIAFTLGAVIPVTAIILPGASLRVPVTFVSVVIALIITGQLSAWVGGADRWKATIRVVLGGVVAMAVTYSIGSLFGVNI